MYHYLVVTKYHTRIPRKAKKRLKKLLGGSPLRKKNGHFSGILDVPEAEDSFTYNTYFLKETT